MNCIICQTEFKPKTKYHQFCSRKCAAKNYFSKEKVVTNKSFAPIRQKPKKSELFDWRDYPYTVII